jgi:hypothetical protein
MFVSVTWAALYIDFLNSEARLPFLAMQIQIRKKGLTRNLSVCSLPPDLVHKKDKISRDCSSFGESQYERNPSSSEFVITSWRIFLAEDLWISEDATEKFHTHDVQIKAEFAICSDSWNADRLHSIESAESPFF